MQRLPHAGVKLNYPLLSDITKGISAEYEVSQPHLLPSHVACGKATAAATTPSCSCQQTVLHCHTKSALLLLLQQLHCLGCCALSRTVHCPGVHCPGVHSTHFMLLHALFSERPLRRMLCCLHLCAGAPLVLLAIIQIMPEAAPWCRC